MKGVMQMRERFSKKLTDIGIILFFTAFLITGLLIFDDYGPVSEERNQIDAGHIIWAYITGNNSHYPDLPDLDSYFNRYYGQGGTFITVLAEALFDFSWDINRIWKIRRLWNFFCFFLADIGLFFLIRKRWSKDLPAFLGALNLILLPRMFPEVFYNDRDPLFLSWLIFFFCAMMLFIRKTNIATTVLLGFVMAVTVSVRMFGLILIIPLSLIILRYPAKRRMMIPVIFVFLAVWYTLSPIAWKDPIKVIGTAVLHLTTKQRILDTQGTSNLLFAGRYYPEQNLPWFYLPLWMLISTPFMLLFLAAFGGVSCCKNRRNDSLDEYAVIDFSLGIFFLLFMIGIPLIRPTLYSGWRHFYFLNLSLIWFAVLGIEHILKSQNQAKKITLVSLEGISLLMALTWIITAHPYEGVYYSPVFRRAAADKFERDMGFTSTKECLEYLADISPDQKIDVMNANAFIPFSLIGLPKPVRERFTTIDWKMQRSPMRYIIFNYNNEKGNDRLFPYYAPIYSIERNGTKLAEIFQRTNNNLLVPENAVKSVHASVNNAVVSAVFSDRNQQIWQGADPRDPDEWISIELNEKVNLQSLEVFPGDIAAPCESLRFSVPDNSGNIWKELPAEPYGTNGWLISPGDAKQLRITSADSSGLPWQIRQILLYGNTEPQ